jgi:hypothetical protein
VCTSHTLSTAEYSVVILNAGYRKGYGVNYIIIITFILPSIYIFSDMESVKVYE